MREWLATPPWWSVLAVYAACLAGSIFWTRREVRRLDAAGPDAIDTRAELTAADTAAAYVILAMCCAYMLLPNPWPGTIRSIFLSLAMTGLVAALFFPVRRRAAKIEESAGADLIRGIATDAAVTTGLFASVLLSVVLFSWAGIAAVTRHALSPQGAALLVLVGVCACYGSALYLHAAWSPWLLVGGDRGGRVRDGVLFDLAEAAFKRAGLPSPDVFLVDGRFEGGHIVGYCGLPGAPVKPILLVEERLLSEVTVRELSAVLRHEASHAARNHIAGDTLWRWLSLALPGACAWLAGVAVARFYSPDFAFIAAILAFLCSFPLPIIYSLRRNHRRELDADADAVFQYGAELEAMLDGVARIEALNGVPAKSRYWETSTHPDLETRTAELRRRAALSAR
jgi:Zn-dependent protease with chaperone function